MYGWCYVVSGLIKGLDICQPMMETWEHQEDNLEAWDANLQLWPRMTIDVSSSRFNQISHILWSVVFNITTI